MKWEGKKEKKERAAFQKTNTHLQDTKQQQQQKTEEAPPKKDASGDQ